MSKEFDENKTLYPTKHCFTDAMDWMEYVVKDSMEEKEGLPDMQLVHAICQGNYDGVEYSHAWVEDNCLNVVISSGMLKGERVYYYVDKKDWYELHQVKEKSVYDFTQIVLRNLSTGHYGPWEEKYQKLCGRTDVFLGEKRMQIKLLGPLPTTKQQQGEKQT